MECVEEATEADLLDRARGGDPDAFCDLVAPMEERLLAQAFFFCRDRSLAEDLVQQTMVEAWKALHRYDASCRLSTWLYSILLHRHHKTLRASRRWPVAFPILGIDGSEGAEWETSSNNPVQTPDHLVALAETQAVLARALEQLSHKHREVVVLRFFHGADLEEIAQVARCSVGTVKSRLHHALRRLRSMKTLMESLGR